MAQKIDRTGETRMMQCGLKATIILYRNARDLDIQFENGVVCQHTSYVNFCKGITTSMELIASLKRGETRRMTNGMKATIIEYRGYNDVDVQFEDGVITQHKRYDSFLLGHIAHPDDSTSAMAKLRIGQTKIMNNCQLATIIGYRKSEDIDVEFEDGTIRTNVSYASFVRGTIANPNIKYNVGVSLQEFAISYYLSKFGFIKIQQGEWESQGFGKQELDLYHELTNIAIEIDGGWHEKKHIQKRDLKKTTKCKNLGIQLYRIRIECDFLNDGSIEYVVQPNKRISQGYYDCKEIIESILRKHAIPFDENAIDFIRDEEKIKEAFNAEYLNHYSKSRVGKKNYSHLAQQDIEITKYNSANDVTVKFTDGCVRENITYRQFLLGQVRHPSQLSDAEIRIGQSNLMNCGFEAVITGYRSYMDIDVKFEDGATREHVTYQSFKRGGISHPKRIIKNEDHIGETKMMNCGMLATVIKWEKSELIDVKFENGCVRTGVRYTNFKRGKIRPLTCDDVGKSRIGEAKEMNCGMIAKVVEYRGFHDIDIEFEDGVVIKHVSYGNFCKGFIKHKKTRVGESARMNNGSIATIIEDRGYDDLDIQFEDGAIAKHKSYNRFKKGSIRYPKTT